MLEDNLIPEKCKRCKWLQNGPNQCLLYSREAQKTYRLDFWWAKRLRGCEEANAFVENDELTKYDFEVSS